MRKFLLFLIFTLCGGAFLSANVPYFSSPDEPEKHYDAQSFRERLTNLKNDDLDTENMVRLAWVLPELATSYFVYDIEIMESSGLGKEYLNSQIKRGSVLTQSSPLIGFMLRRSERISIGIDCFYTTQRYNTYNVVTSEVIQTHKEGTFALNSYLQWDILRHEWFRFYLKAGVGLYFNTQDNDSEPDLFVGYGYTVGKRIFFFAEGNAGLNNFINNFGIGYRF